MGYSSICRPCSFGPSTKEDLPQLLYSKTGIYHKQQLLPEYFLMGSAPSQQILSRIKYVAARWPSWWRREAQTDRQTKLRAPVLLTTRFGTFLLAEFLYFAMGEHFLDKEMLALALALFFTVWQWLPSVGLSKIPGDIQLVSLHQSSSVGLRVPLWHHAKCTALITVGSTCAGEPAASFPVQSVPFVELSIWTTPWRRCWPCYSSKVEEPRGSRQRSEFLNLLAPWMQLYAKLFLESILIHIT